MLMYVCALVRTRRVCAQAHPGVCAREGAGRGVTPLFRAQKFFWKTTFTHLTVAAVGGIMVGHRVRSERLVLVVDARG